MGKKKNKAKLRPPSMQGMGGQSGDVSALPPGVRDFRLKDDGGIKVLDETSNATASAVRYNLIPLENQIRQAQTMTQRKKEKDIAVTINPIDVMQKYPMVGKWMDEDQVNKIIIESTPESADPRKWACGIMAQRLQIPEETIARYARGGKLKK